MERESQLVRAFRLLRLLARTGGSTLDELASELGVVRRTVYRDLEALEEAGAPVHVDAETWPRRWHVRAEFLDLGGLRISSHELVALTTLARLQKSGDGTFAAALDDLTTKLRTMVPQPVLEETDRQLARMAVPPWVEGLSPQSPLVAVKAGPASDAVRGACKPLEDRLQRAIEGGEELEIEYRSRSARGAGRRTVLPLGLATRPSGTYLLAWDLDDLPQASPDAGDGSAAGASDWSGVRKYKLARIDDLESTGATFEPPADFAADAVFSGSFGVHGSPVETVCVRFSPQAAAFVRERRWHPSQRLDDTPGGGLVLTLEVGGLLELKSWVQSFGADAEVLEPAALADEIAADARRVVKAWSASRLARRLSQRESRRRES